LSNVQIPPQHGLRFNIGKWLEERTFLNNAVWHDSSHHALQIVRGDRCIVTGREGSDQKSAWG